MQAAQAAQLAARSSQLEAARAQAAAAQEATRRQQIQAAAAEAKKLGLFFKVQICGLANAAHAQYNGVEARTIQFEPSGADGPRFCVVVDSSEVRIVKVKNLRIIAETDASAAGGAAQPRAFFMAQLPPKPWADGKRHVQDDGGRMRHIRPPSFYQPMVVPGAVAAGGGRGAAGTAAAGTAADARAADARADADGGARVHAAADARAGASCDGGGGAVTPPVQQKRH